MRPKVEPRHAGDARTNRRLARQGDASQFLAELFFSLAPGFSRVNRAQRKRKRFQPFSAPAATKPLKRLGAGGTPALVRLRGRWDRAVEVRSCAVRSRAVSNRNCVVAMRGGEQRNENDQSVTQADQAGSRRELDSVGVGGRVCERKTKPVTAGVNPLATWRTPVNTQMVGDGMAGSPNGRNQGDPPGTSGVHGGSARRTARRESERPK